MITKEQAQAKLNAFIAGDVHVMTISTGAEAIRTIIALHERLERLDAVTNTLSEMWEGEQTARHSAEAELAATQAKLARLATYEAFTTDGWGFSHPEITARVQYARAALEGAKP